MMTFQEVLSHAQASIGDLAFQDIEREEWFHFADRVLEHLAGNTRMWMAYNGQVPYPTGAPDGVITDVIIPQCHKAIMVMRNGTECLEVSWQATQQRSVTEARLRGPNVNERFLEEVWGVPAPPTALIQADARTQAFRMNSSEIGRRTFATKANFDESLTLHFPVPFDRDEVVDVWHYGKVRKPIRWNSTPAELRLPDWMTPTMINGMVFYALERHMLRSSDPNIPVKAQYMQTVYEKSVREMKAYLANIKDENSQVIVQPMKWLPDNKENSYYG